jgi:hypothetical protein
MFPALTARPAKPIVEFDVSSAGSVGSQQLAHEGKEVKEPAIVERGTNRPATVSFTQYAIADVRMVHTLVGHRRVRFQGNDSIGVRIAEPIPSESDLKRAQFHASQRDRHCGDTDFRSLQVALDLFKLLF